jgi:hypothetical protein
LLTMPTALNFAIAGSDISASFRPTDDDRFMFFGGETYSVEFQMTLFTHIFERNDIIRKVCAARKVPLVDLFTAFDSSRLDDYRKYFFDMTHPRIAAYPMMAMIVREAIRPILARQATGRTLASGSSP